MNLPDRSERDLLGSGHDGAHQNPAIASFQLDRRHFLKLLGGGLLVCLTHDVEWAQESGRAFGGHELPKDLGSWLHIAADGQVKVFTGKVEVGQNIRTSRHIVPWAGHPDSRQSRVMAQPSLRKAP